MLHLELVLFRGNLFFKLPRLRFRSLSNPFLTWDLVQLHAECLLHLVHTLVDLAVPFLELLRISGHVLLALLHSLYLTYKSLPLFQQIFLLLANGDAAIFVKLSTRPSHIYYSRQQRQPQVYCEHEFAASARFQDATRAFSFFSFSFFFVTVTLSVHRALNVNWTQLKNSHPRNYSRSYWSLYYSIDISRVLSLIDLLIFRSL